MRALLAAGVMWWAACASGTSGVPTDASTSTLDDAAPVVDASPKNDPARAHRTASYEALSASRATSMI